MRSWPRRIALLLLLSATAYLFAWPTPVEPVAWDAPPDPGYTGDFAANDRLSAATALTLHGGAHGPEDVVGGPDGRLYVTTDRGIQRSDVARTRFDAYADTGGRPLGIAFGAYGRLIVADAALGLLEVGADGRITVLADSADGTRLGFTDHLDAHPDGRIFFSDASTRHPLTPGAHPLEGSVPEILEHRGSGRLLVWEPTTRKARTVVADLHFANGVAVDSKGDFVLVVETGAYRVLKHHLTGPDAGRTVPFAGPLPGFPDNIRRGHEDNTWWVGLVAPRDALLDGLSNWPTLRRAISRLPKALRPAAKRYGHVIKLGADGQILDSLQDPSGHHAHTTGAWEDEEALWISSLTEPHLARLPRSALRRPAAPESAPQ